MTGEEVRISHADFARSGAHAGFVESGESIDLARYRGRAGTSANSLEGGPEPILRFNEEEELGGDDPHRVPRRTIVTAVVADHSRFLMRGGTRPGPDLRS
jgi:hypothetical protein